ncbi:hypothetical protein HanRHA438_Chr13g0597581 [Helianthus annuus]|nr:hypothetical protein HanRHA438_Chr13g0597581 [Helianthus annuus]
MMPISVWYGRMCKNSANDIVYGSYFMFGFTILGGCTWARKTKVHAVLFAKKLKLRISILLSIVTLKLLNFPFKLCVNKIGKGCEYGEHL